MIAYLIFEVISGDITQLAVAPSYRRKGIGSYLLAKATELNQNSVLKIINTEKDCSSVNQFLKAKSILPSGQQYEMILELFSDL